MIVDLVVVHSFFPEALALRYRDKCLHECCDVLGQKNILGASFSLPLIRVKKDPKASKADKAVAGKKLAAITNAVKALEKGELVHFAPTWDADANNKKGNYETAEPGKHGFDHTNGENIHLVPAALSDGKISPGRWIHNFCFAENQHSASRVG